MIWRRRGEGMVHSSDSKTGVDEHGDCPQPPARVQRDRQINAGRDHERDPLSWPNIVLQQTSRDSLDTSMKISERNHAAACRHLDDGWRLAGAKLVEGSPYRSPLYRMDRRGRDRPFQPVEQGTRNVGVLGHEVARTNKTVDIGVRQPRLEIVKVPVGKHPVARAPHQQGRCVFQQREAGGDVVEGCCT